MKKSIEQDIANAESYGTISRGFEGESQDVRLMTPVMPTAEGDIKRCMECAVKGIPDELENDFILGGFDSRDGKADIIMQLSCSGLGMLQKMKSRSCGLAIKQYDEQGNVLSEMRAGGE